MSKSPTPIAFVAFDALEERVRRAFRERRETLTVSTQEAWDIFQAIIFSDSPDPISKLHRTTHPHLTKRELRTYAAQAALDLYRYGEVIPNQLGTPDGNAKGPAAIAIENLLAKMGDTLSPPSVEAMNLYKLLLREATRPIVTHTYNNFVEQNGKPAKLADLSQRQIIELLLERPVYVANRGEREEYLLDHKIGVVPMLISFAFRGELPQSIVITQAIMNQASYPLIRNHPLGRLRNKDAVEVTETNEWLDRLADERTEIDRERELAHIYRAYNHVAECMTPRQREIVEYHFGIHDGVHKTWEETETHFDTTRQNISIVMQAAKAAMAKAFRAVVEAGDYPGTGEGSPEAEAARNLLRDNNGQRPR